MIHNTGNQMNNNRKIVEESVKDFYSAQGQTHGIEHLERTVELAVFLGKKEEADIEVVRLGALLHQLHDQKKAEDILEKTDLEESVIQRIVKCVKYSDLENVENADSVESKVVYDADKLQVIGPFGLIREIACETGERGNNFKEALENSRKIEEKCLETLQTDTGKKIGQKHHEIIDEFWKLFDKMDNVNLGDSNE